MEDKTLNTVEANQVTKEKNLEYEFSAEISAGNEKGTVHCFSVNGVKQYKVIAKDGNFDGIDNTIENPWEKKLEKDKAEREKDDLERNL